MTDYILFIYAEHPNQDEFVKGIANDISLVSDSDQIKYYYGSTSAIITFQSTDCVSELHEFLGMIFDEQNIVHILLPYKTDNMSAGMSPENFKHLFNVDITETKQEKETPVRNLSDEETRDRLTSFINEFSYEEEDDDEILKIKRKAVPLSIDDILDKISSEGIESLTTQERKFLEHYSKNN